MPCVQFIKKADVGAFGESALLVNESEHIEGVVGNQIEDILIILKLDVRPVDALRQVLLLLQLEDVSHKILLNILIGVVYTELFKARR